MRNIERNKIKMGSDDKGLTFFIYLFLVASLIIVGYPLIYILSASISSPESVIKGSVWLFPVGIDFRAYKEVFSSTAIVIGYVNSFLYTVVGTIINLILTILVAYPLSRKEMYGRNIFTWFFIFTMFFSGGLIPFYLVMQKLHLIDSFWSMIVPGAISIWNMIIMRTYFQMSIPNELYEAAYLDGCNDINILIKVVLPLSKPIIAVMVLYYSVGHWNDYYNALIFISQPGLYPLQIVLRDLLIMNQVDSQIMTQSASSLAQKEGMSELLRYAIIVVASLPVLIIYPFVQKYFVKGIMIGSIKG